MANTTQTKMFGSGKDAAPQAPVECLGIKFPNDEARRAYFIEQLREKLKDSEFRKTPGFPLGDDEDILALSDPPYYTACPNPFLEALLQQSGNQLDGATDNYSREPFAADVSEGKGDPIYNAHSYHTKVPHKAIMRYILHYTEPGDLVFDGFSGSGMTGVAAQLCGNRSAVESLGYVVKPNRKLLTEDGSQFSELGSRRAVLTDLSPAATFIASNYNTIVDNESFRAEAERSLAQAEAECAWMYLTLNQPKPVDIKSAISLLTSHTTDLAESRPDLPWGRINYTIWSDVFVCSECSGEVIFWDVAVDMEIGKVREEFSCPHCKAKLTKRSIEREFVTVRDEALNQTIRQLKQVPVFIYYTVGKQRREKKPDDFDRALLNVIEARRPLAWFPIDRMPDGEESRRNDDIGITHVHHFYTQRNLKVISSLRSAGLKTWLPFNALTPRATKLHRIAASRLGGEKKGEGGATVGVLSGTLYIPSNSVEMNVLDQSSERITAAVRGLSASAHSFISTGSASSVPLPDGSVDYIFTDPPFGGNLMYSELNFHWEAWLRVFTNNGPEAIENRIQLKKLGEYQKLMTECFVEFFRVLKPGRWMTVEFHNSQNRIWTAIQEGIQHAGFVVCDVRTLDKQQGSFKQYNSANAVKQDLVISAYKPSGAFERQFHVVAGTEAGAWEFVRSHLRHIPVFVVKAERAEVIAERQGYLLFDRMVAFHVQRGYSVPLSAAEFYSGLRQRFPEREGMYFLSDQVAEYDRQRLSIKEVMQLQLFVNDEKTAIQWVRQQLADHPMTYQALSPLYMKEAQRVWEKHEQPLELINILEQNFITDTDNTWRVPDPKKEADLEQLRNRALLKEFQQYLDAKGKLKVVRTEALRVGFKECWQKKDYTTILQMAKRIPEAVIQEDPALLMYFDNASLLLGE